MIVVEHIIYHIPDKKAILEDVSFKIRPGEVTVLLGPNGAGKSTLLRILSGERKPSSGHVMWEGKSIHSIPPRELATKRAVLTQQYAMSLPFTVAEVVQMGRYPHTSQKLSAADREIVTGCLRAMQVEKLSGRLFHTLSGGEQQRVQMARVLAQLETGHESRADVNRANVNGTDVNHIDVNGSDVNRADGWRTSSAKFLLLDEPTASMDWLHQQLTLEKAKEMASRGYMVIVVLHDLNLAAQYADRLILLRQGRLLSMGRPEEIIEPALIEEAYGIQVSVLHPDGCDFPVIVPIKNILIKHPKL